MAWIKYIEEDEAEGPLSRLYDQLLEPESGRVDHILKIHGPDPGALRGHLQLYRSVMEETESLPRSEREMIAFTVSRVNECHY
jgi:alkylhydroperoxidase family enzyme